MQQAYANTKSVMFIKSTYRILTTDTCASNSPVVSLLHLRKLYRVNSPFTSLAYQANPKFQWHEAPSFFATFPGFYCKLTLNIFVHLPKSRS